MLGPRGRSAATSEERQESPEERRPIVAVVGRTLGLVGVGLAFLSFVVAALVALGGSLGMGGPRGVELRDWAAAAANLLALALGVWGCAAGDARRYPLSALGFLAAAGAVVVGTALWHVGSWPLSAVPLFLLAAAVLTIFPAGRRKS